MLPEEDATFTLTSECDETTVVITATITGDTGGVFSFGETPNDDAVINPETGEITEATGGATYTVMYTTSGNCPMVYEQTIQADNCLMKLIPEVITPNRDGFNDTFDLTGYDVTSLEIFNRNGVKVYSKTNGYIKEFEGIADNGDELPVGTYFYVMKYGNNEVRTSWLYINK